MSTIESGQADATHAAESAQAPARVYGVLAEFDTVDGIMGAAEAVRDAGYKRFDVHAPFPIHGIDDAMGIKPTMLPWLTLFAGIAGTTAGLVLTMYTMATYWDLPFLPEMLKGYEYLISGKPLDSLQAYIPVAFETTILLAAVTTVFAMFLMNKLPMLYHPLSKNETFRRATDDRFFVVIESSDQKYDATGTAEFLRDQGALTVETVEE